MHTKICNSCGIEKPYDAFYKNKKSDDGYFWRCKQCEKIRQRIYQKKHNTLINAHMRAKYAMLDESKKEILRDKCRNYRNRNYEACLKREKEYHTKNKSKRNKSCRAYYTKHREEILNKRNKTRDSINNKIWRMSHPERCKLRDDRRRAREANAAFIEDINRNDIYLRDKGICSLCGKKIKLSDTWHIDHTVPLSKGGEHSYRNVGISHKECNIKKKARVSLDGHPIQLRLLGCVPAYTSLGKRKQRKDVGR